jgi:SAM-dependent methyltransferase
VSAGVSSLRAVAHRLPPLLPQLGLRAVKTAVVIPGSVRYLLDRRAYRALSPAEPLRWRDSLPKVGDRLATTPYDSHYLFQDTWAARRIAEAAPARHVDVGSRVDYVCFLTAITKVAFVDIRPLAADVEGVESITGSILDLPFEDRSLTSLSCLHVVEHIGLGRYGDPLDPEGSRKAIAQLQRVLAPGGHLLFSTPVGRARVCFNAHRVHDPVELRELFGELELLEFAGVDDTGAFRRHRRVEELAGQSYSCGMYHLRRPA